MKPDQVWRAALGELQLQMTRASYDTWLRSASLIAYEDGTYIIGVRSDYAKDWLEERLLTTVKRTLAGITDNEADVRFVVWADELVESNSSAALTPSTPQRSLEVGKASADLPDPRQSFEAFVVGPNNRLAHAAALAVSESPGSVYNPLFLYGGVGLGKSHLLRSVGALCSSSGLRVVCVSCEEFTNDLVQAIRFHSTEDFRNKYRTPDVLLIDDIHFVSGKDSTQQELLQTYNALRGRNKQIVLCSSLSPRAIPSLDERLRSRFESGLAVEMRLPDRETRLAILQARATALSREVPPEVLGVISARCQGNVLELEGALNQVLAQTEILGHPLDTSSAEAALSNLRSILPNITPEKIVAVVARHYDLSSEDLCGRSRARAVALPRQLAMYLIRELTSVSLPRAGEALGGRDHTTVKHGCDKVGRLVKEDTYLQRQASAIKEALYSPISPL